MQGTLVIGYDGSEPAGDALALGERLSGATGRPIVLVGVYEADDFPAAAVLHRDSVCAALHTAGVPDDVERHAVAGRSIAEGLLLFAEEHDAAAIVVGSSVRARPGRIGAGSVAHHLLHSSPCAVAVAPRGYAARPGASLEHVAVAYIDSDEGLAALRVAADLARTARARLRVVTVTDVPRGVTDHRDALRAEHRRQLDEALGQLANTVAVEGVLLDGDPVQRLLEQCEAGVDLIVTGSRGSGPVKQVLLGSVSSRLMTSAPVPVLVVPRGTVTELIAGRLRARDEPLRA